MSTTPVAGCCGAMAVPLTAPVPITNASGLPAIQYRIGTFSSFRQAMLDDVALADLLATVVTTVRAEFAADADTLDVVDASQFPLSAPFRIKVGSEYVDVVDGAGTSVWTVTRTAASAHEIGEPVVLAPLNPFANWHEGITGDYQTMFVELWAYLADILTFYQERIANEAYLQTATQRNSLLQLAGLVDYVSNPGSGADGLISFLAAKNQSVVVPAGFRVANKPAPGQQKVVFETSTAITATGENSRIPLSLVSPDVQFASNTIVLAGTNTGLQVNDFALAVEGTIPSLIQISSVNADKVANTTTITWPATNGGYNEASKQVVLYQFRTTAAPFGSTAPVWSTLPPVLTNSLSDGTQHVGALFDTDWDRPTESYWDEFIAVLEAEAPRAAMRDAAPSSLPQRFEIGRNPVNGLQFIVDRTRDIFLYESTNPWFYIPMPGDPRNVLFLDTVYSDLKYSAQSPGWAVVMTGGGAFQILQVTQSRQVAKAGYTLTSKVTRLDCASPVTEDFYPLRDTTILTGVQSLPVQQDLPLPADLSDSTLVLAGVQGQLQDGQTIVLTGTVSGTVTAQSGGTVASETCVIDGVPVTDAANGVTVVQLKRPLANRYVRSSCAVMANIVEVTQGETVKDEVLGSGNGSASQMYVLKQSPLTYLPSTDASSLLPVESTLSVMVNGVDWIEQANFAASAPHDQHYTVTISDGGSTVVTFGDGVHGACPPSGMQNIHAHYRKGLGNSGNVAGGAVSLLVDSLPGLQGVVNPVGFNGGSDADSIDDIRTQAPTSLKTFSRAVSITDYAALALSYPGIAKASASLVQQDPSTGKPLVHPFIQLTVASSSQAPILGTPLAGKLRQYLDSRRDTNVMLRILDGQPVYIAVSVEIDIDSRYPHQGTINAVQAALNPGINPDGSAGYFAFASLQFGQPIYLSDLYAAIQAVPGVLDANVTQLKQVGTPALGAGASRLLLTQNLQASRINPGLHLNFPLLSRVVIPVVAASTPAAQDIAVGQTEIVTIDPSAATGSGLFVTGQGGYADS